MMVIKFIRNFDWSVGDQIHEHKAGYDIEVTDDCGETAIELGYGFLSGLGYPEEADADAGDELDSDEE